MANFEKHNILWQVLLWWGGWHLVSFLLANGYEYPNDFMARAMASLVAFSAVVYINLKALLPKLFFQKKFFLFFGAGISLLLLVTVFLYEAILPLLDWFDLVAPREGPPLEGPPPETNRRGPPPLGIRLVIQVAPYLIAFLGSTIIEVFRFANRKEREVIQAEKEKIDSELKFLKSQVNPHFLFNALNNIYSLAVIQAPQTPESVMQLSEILRYMVYDSNEESVPLKSEINYIQNFVDLHLLKDSRGMDVQLDLAGASEDLRIAPLLLIPFVENAFKHSKIENLKRGYIRIHLSTESEWITFKIINSIPKNKFTKDEVGGVGLENTKKRLELLYPDGQHQLEINQTDDEFDVVLKIAVG